MSGVPSPPDNILLPVRTPRGRRLVRVRQRGTFEDGAPRLVITGPAEAVALLEGYTFTLADGLPLVLRRVEVVPPPDDGTPRLGDGATTRQAAEGVLAVARGVPLVGRPAASSICRSPGCGPKI